MALPKTVGDAKKKGLVPMTDFFGPKVKRGRSKKAASKAGRLATKEVPPTTALTQAVLKPAPMIKDKRRNWSKGDGLKIMTDAVEAWAEELKKPEADQISMTFFAELRGIPFSTLQEHVAPSNSKRIKLGASVGRKPVISPATQAVITDVLIRLDRANQGKGVKEAVDILETMHPGCTRTQLEGSFRRTVRPKFVKVLTGSVTVQATTTKRTSFTVQQQWRGQKVKHCKLGTLVCCSSCPRVLPFQT